MYQLLIYTADMSKKMAEYNNCKDIHSALDIADDFFKRLLGYEFDFYYQIEGMTVIVLYKFMS